MKPSLRRTDIGRVYLNTVGTASVAHFGDNGATRLKSRAIAVQRAIALYDHDETRFAAYSLFAREPLELDTGLEVAFDKAPCEPDLRIGCLKVIALASSSLLRAGTSGPLVSQTWIKHIRQFNNLDKR